jgi:UDP-N-acetylglucosamine 2-epimerase (non-hydrolysing)
MIKLVKFSEGVITDSGGLQKESFILKVPCITLRSESEWPETFSGSMNVLSPDASDIEKLLSRKVDFGTSSPFGYGDAAEKIISSLVSG